MNGLGAERGARGNDATVESVQNQPQVLHASPRRLEIAQIRRDSHIPTGKLQRVQAVENQNQVSHRPNTLRNNDPCLFPLPLDAAANVNETVTHAPGLNCYLCAGLFTSVARSVLFHRGSARLMLTAEC